MPSVERTTIDTDGLEFAALTCGGGDRYALLFHGFPDDPESFEPLMHRLADAGYTAVAPYMRGYGETECPPLEPGNFTAFQLGSDVFALIDALEADEPLVVGHDWGAIAVTTASVTGADAMGECVTMAVPPDFMAALDDHASQALRSWYMTEFQIPGHGEELVRRDDFALLERLWRLWSPKHAVDEDRMASLKETFRTGETVEAALMYYRDFFDEFVARRRSELGISGIDVPTLLVAGARDGCISADLFEGSTDCFDARAELEIVDGAGHFVHVEKPDLVADRVLKFVD